MLSPAVAILLVAPFVGEVLSTSTRPFALLVPINLILQSALYGCGALLCRELARRFRLGLRGLCLLGAAYGVFEEALITRTWFDPQYQASVGLGGYSQLWHTNVLVATHLTAFHIAVSICSSIRLVEQMFPERRARPWASRVGLAVAGFAFLLLVPFLYGDFQRGPALPVLGVAFCLGLALFGGAFLVPRLPHLTTARATTPRPRLIGLVAFLCTGSHFVMVYTLPRASLAWPLVLLITLVPVALGVLLVRRLSTSGFLGPDGLWTVTGILSFFLLLDLGIGLLGRYDLAASAPLSALVLWLLHRRGRRPAAGSADRGAGPAVLS